MVAMVPMPAEAEVDARPIVVGTVVVMPANPAAVVPPATVVSFLYTR